LLSIIILSLASLFSGMTFENPTDGPAWPTSVLFSWSVEWDLSPAGSDPPEWHHVRAEFSVNFRDVCTRVTIFLPR
jgi:hypothetical protein